MSRYAVDGTVRGRFGIGGRELEATVLTETVNGAGVPFEVTKLAGTLQVAARGAPVHASETLPV